LSIPYEQCDLPAELAWDTGKTRGRMSIAVAAPRLLTSGVRAVELAACLHDSLLNALGGEPDLKVSAREADPAAAPNTFTFIVQASVRVVKREVVLGLRCVNPLDQEICWAASERAALCDALDAESKLCNQLLQELRSAASGYWGRQAWKQYRQSSGFAAFAEGQQFVAARTIASFSIARQKFQRALQLDPSCAPALVGMEPLVSRTGGGGPRGQADARDAKEGRGVAGHVADRRTSSSRRHGISWPRQAGVKNNCNSIVASSETDTTIGAVGASTP